MADLIPKGFKLRISNSIILLNTILIFITGFVIITITSRGVETTVMSMGRNLVTEISKSVEHKTIAYLEPAERACRDIGYLLWTKTLDPVKGTGAMLDYFREVLKMNNEFKMVYFADADGNLSMTRRMPDGSFTRRYVRRHSDRVEIRFEHENPDYYGEFKNSNDSLEAGYDPRTRPWFVDALTKRGMAWTSLYIFATDLQPGFSCALPIFREDGSLEGVVSVDIGVAELSLFLGSIQLTPGARLFITGSDQRVVALQARTKKDVEALMLKSTDKDGRVSLATLAVDAVRDPVIPAVAAKAIKEKLSGVTFTVDAHGAHLAFVRTLEEGTGAGLNIGIVIPEDDIMGEARRNNLVVSLFSALMVLIALLVSVLLSRAIAKPMSVLSEEMGKIKDFVLDSDRRVNTIIYEIDDMQTSFDGMKKGLNNFRKYVPADLVSQLIQESEEANLGGESRELTIFFSDIAGFTSIAERTAPEDLVKDLCEYFSVMSEAILSEQGTLDKYIGDSVMAFWGAPRSMADHAKKACASAIICRDRLASLFMLWENRGRPRFTTRMGINTGTVVVGNMGYEKRMNYTCIGDPVNLASRLEGLNKAYGTGILVSDSTWQLAKDDFAFRQVDRVAVVGKKEGVNVYELIAPKDYIQQNLKKLHGLYEVGMAYYFDGRWKDALKYFETVLKYRPGDGPAKVLAARVRGYLVNPPAEDWNGVFSSHEK